MAWKSHRRVALVIVALSCAGCVAGDRREERKVLAAEMRTGAPRSQCFVEATLERGRARIACRRDTTVPHEVRDRTSVTMHELPPYNPFVDVLMEPLMGAIGVVAPLLDLGELFSTHEEKTCKAHGSWHAFRFTEWELCCLMPGIMHPDNSLGNEGKTETRTEDGAWREDGEPARSSDRLVGACVVVLNRDRVVARLRTDEAGTTAFDPREHSATLAAIDWLETRTLSVRLEEEGTTSELPEALFQRERAAAVESAVARLREARESRDWLSVERTASRILRADPAHREARSLLDEAGGELGESRGDDAVASGRDADAARAYTLAVAARPSDERLKRKLDGALASWSRSLSMEADAAASQGRFDAALVGHAFAGAILRQPGGWRRFQEVLQTYARSLVSEIGRARPAEEMPSSTIGRILGAAGAAFSEQRRSVDERYGPGAMERAAEQMGDPGLARTARNVERGMNAAEGIVGAAQTIVVVVEARDVSVLGDVLAREGLAFGAGFRGGVASAARSAVERAVAEATRDPSLAARAGDAAQSLIENEATVSKRLSTRDAAPLPVRGSPEIGPKKSDNVACPRCGVLCSARARFCSKCGASLRG